MAQKGIRPPSPEVLKQAFLTDLRAVWSHARATHATKSPYAFVLYGVEGTPRLMPQVLFEESLTEVAQDYLSKLHYESLEEARRALRYSVADSPLFNEFAGRLSTVNAAFETVAERLGETKGYEKLAKAAIEALTQLDEEGLFGTGEQRENLLLAIFTDDTTVDWTLKSVKRLNPASCVERFQKFCEPHGDYKSSRGVAVTGDASVVVSIGSVKDPKYKRATDNEFLSTVIVYDCDSLKLTERWTFSVASFGDSFRDLKILPDQKHFVVLRQRYNPSKLATLIRFSMDSTEPIAEGSVEIEAAAFDYSSEAGCFALTAFNGQLVLFDEAFGVIHKQQLGSKRLFPHFLRDGTLLLGSQGRTYVFDCATRSVLRELPYDGFHLSSDKRQTLLAVSRWFDIGRKRIGEPEPPFGMSLLSLPSFDLVRDISIADKRLVRPTISSDGRLLVVHAKPLQGNRDRAAIFDIASGNLAGMIKTGGHNEPMVFLLNDAIVAIPETGLMKGAPIRFWRLSEAV